MSLSDLLLIFPPRPKFDSKSEAAKLVFGATTFRQPDILPNTIFPHDCEGANYQKRYFVKLKCKTKPC
jgi:hypothetical protein